jgi:hypothetical protein
MARLDLNCHDCAVRVLLQAWVGSPIFRHPTSKCLLLLLLLLLLL